MNYITHMKYYAGGPSIDFTREQSKSYWVLVQAWCQNPVCIHVSDVDELHCDILFDEDKNLVTIATDGILTPTNKCWNDDWHYVVYRVGTIYGKYRHLMLAVLDTRELTLSLFDPNGQVNTHVIEVTRCLINGVLHGMKNGMVINKVHQTSKRVNDASNCETICLYLVWLMCRGDRFEGAKSKIYKLYNRQGLNDKLLEMQIKLDLDAGR
jgi:hypothetical protein